jgi:HEPN domain-containing protein
LRQHELVRVLLHKAAQDEAALERLLPHADLDDELIGFHAQQAVEKLLKAWLAHLGVDYPRIHSLGTLVEILGAHECTLPPELADVSRLTPFATVFRYEHLPPTAALDRAEALRLVQGMRALITAIVDETAGNRGA